MSDHPKKLEGADLPKWIVAAKQNIPRHLPCYSDRGLPNGDLRQSQFLPDSR
jgi:hypothetical protein